MDHCYLQLRGFINYLKKEETINQRKEEELQETLKINLTPQQDQNQMCQIAQLWFSLEKELIECFSLTFGEGSIDKKNSGYFSFELQDAKAYCIIKQTKTYFNKLKDEHDSPSRQKIGISEVNTKENLKSKIETNGNQTSSTIITKTVEKEKNNQDVQHPLDSPIHNKNCQQSQLKAILQTISHIKEEEPKIFESNNIYYSLITQQRDIFLQALTNQKSKDDITQEIKQCLERFQQKKYGEENPACILNSILVQLVRSTKNHEIFNDALKLKFCEGLKCSKCNVFYESYSDGEGGYQYKIEFQLGLDFDSIQYLSQREIVHNSPYHNYLLYCHKCKKELLHTFERECIKFPKILILKNKPLEQNLLNGENTNCISKFMNQWNVKINNNIYYTLKGVFFVDSTQSSTYLRCHELKDKEIDIVNLKPIYLIYKKYII